MNSVRDSVIVNLTNIRSRIHVIHMVTEDDPTHELLFAIDLVLWKILNNPEVPIPDGMDDELHKLDVRINVLTNDFVKRHLR